MLVRPLPRRIIDMRKLPKIILPPPLPVWERPMLDTGATFGNYDRPLNRHTGSVHRHLEVYRFSLWRQWDTTKPPLLFVMLNPSTADASINDPTIKRCMFFADKLGYGGIKVLNLFPYRATKPAELYKEPHVPIDGGNVNRELLLNAIYDAAQTETPKQSGMHHSIICGWGSLNIAERDAQAFAHMALDSDVYLYCLEKTKHGHPKHPLYISGDAKPIEYRPWETPGTFSLVPSRQSQP